MNNSANLLSLYIHETLVALSADLQPIPMLAESWKVSDDRLTYTFTLRKGIKFHNGTVMTSKDVLATVKRNRAIGARAAIYDNVESTTAPDDYTVVFRLKAPSIEFLRDRAHMLGDEGIQPANIILKADGTPKAANALKVPEEIVGAGPYKLVEYNPDSLIVLKRHDGYQPLPGTRSGAGGGKLPYFDEIRIAVVPEDAAQIAGLQTGTYDAATGDIKTSTYIALRGASASGVSTGTYFPGLMYCMLINHSDRWTGQLKFRQAVQAAVDVDEIGKVFSGGDTTLYSLNPYIWAKGTGNFAGDDPIVESLYNQKNLEKAKALLKETGYNGEEIIVIQHGDTIAPVFVEQLKRVGINAKIKVLDNAADAAARSQKTGWNFTFNNWAGLLIQPVAFRNYWYSTATYSGRGFYESKALDAALDAARAAPSFAMQKKALADVQRIAMQDVLWIKLFDTPYLSVWRTSLQDFKPYTYPLLYSTSRQK
jgi:peptide/nickel transport system substrate-binding protein